MATNTKFKRVPIQGHNRIRMEYIGNLLINYRYGTMLSREDFAHEFGISKSLVERIETGKNITVHSLLRICDIFQITPEEIFEGVE